MCNTLVAYPDTRAHKMKEYYKTHMVDNLEVVEVDSDVEFIMNILVLPFY